MLCWALHAVLLLELVLQVACAGPAARPWNRCCWTWLLAVGKTELVSCGHTTSRHVKAYKAGW
jgi:hypothetical protein